MSSSENAAFGIRPNSDYPNRTCCLRDPYKIGIFWNISMHVTVARVSCAAFSPFFSGSVILPNAAEITDLVSKYLQTKNV